MGWNGSGSAAQSANRRGGILPPQKKKSPSLLRGVLAGILVVVLAGVAALWFFNRPAPKVAAPKEPKKSAAIKAVTPAAAPTNRVAEVKRKKNQPDKNGIIDPGPPPNFRGSVITNANGTVYYSPDPGFAERYRIAQAEQDKLPFKTRAEREISSIIDVQPGQFVLETEFPPDLEKDFLEHLEDPIVIKDDDDEHTVALKKTMMDLKPQLKAAMDRGEKLADLLTDYRKQLVKANALKENLQRELTAIQREAKSEDEVKDFIKAANKMLDEYGVEHFPVKVSPMMLHLIERNQQNAENN